MKPWRKLTAVLRIFLFGIGFALIVQNLQADSPAKPELVAKYDQIIALSQQLNLGNQDLSDILPDIRNISQMLLEGQWDEADALMDQTLKKLDELRSRRPFELQIKTQTAVLSIYVEIFQKYVLLALLAFLCAIPSAFRKILKIGKTTPMQQLLMTVVIVIFSSLFSYYDYVRYGFSGWGFFELSSVLVMIAGILTGLWGGILTGILAGGFRWFLDPQAFVFVFTIAAAGLLGGFFSSWCHGVQKIGTRSLITGMVFGAMQGTVIYLPLSGLISWVPALWSIGLMILLNGIALFTFFGITAAVTRHEMHHETEEELLKTRLSFLQAQIKPHFLFNALETIAGVCASGKVKETEDLIIHLGDFFKEPLRHGRERISLQEEVEFMDHYLMIEQARYGDRLTVHKEIHIADSLWGIEVPHFFLQPLVENAIRHGLGKKAKGGHVKIILSRDDKDLVICVEDDGVGMNPVKAEAILNQQKVETEGTGIGLKNIHERLLKYYGKRYGLSIASEVGKGTKITVRIPIQLNEGGSI